MILATDIAKFKRLYYKYFGIELDNDAARTELASLVRVVELSRNEMGNGSEQEVETSLPAEDF